MIKTADMIKTVDMKKYDEFIYQLTNEPSVKNAFKKILETLSQKILDSISQDLYVKSREEGAASVIRRLINLYNSIDNMDCEQIKQTLKSIFNIYGVVKVESDTDVIDVTNNSFYQVVDVINEPENPDNVVPITPGYYMKCVNGETLILQYGTVKINEAHYEQPLNIFKVKDTNETINNNQIDNK